MELEGDRNYKDDSGEGKEGDDAGPIKIAICIDVLDDPRIINL